MSSERDAQQAVSDADLVRFLDGELPEEEHARLAALIEADPASADRLRTLRRRGASLGGILRDYGPDDYDVSEAGRTARARLGLNDIRSIQSARRRPAVASSGTPVWARAAAVVTLLLLGALATPPARAWVAGTLARLSEILSGDQASSPPLVPAPAEPDDEVSITFAVPADTFELHVGGSPAGQLLLLATDAASASARAIGDPAAGLTLLPAGLRIEAGGSPDAIFRLELPHGRVVRVFLPDAAPALYTLPAPGEPPVVLPLGQ